MSANHYLSETTIEQVRPLIIGLTANSLVEWASCPFLYPALKSEVRSQKSEIEFLAQTNLDGG
ncbi:MAG: hypothetical protein F6K17_27010 [Okeania sp. SIO3C4]|nr:hypothetical protein [Okeania sp. SIO3C4]